MQTLHAWDIGSRAGGVDIDMLARTIVQRDLEEYPELLDFAVALVRRTYDNHAEIDSMIAQIAENWEFDRIAAVDRAILRMGMAELLFFPEIPPRATINEAIDIAKLYSTEKSGMFVNGILDAAVERLRTSGRLTKSGRGLIGD